MAALTIENEDVDRLVQELAEREGKSMTTVVREAVEAQLERTRSAEQEDAGLAERLLAIGRSTAPLWSEPRLSRTHGDLLYDEHGLPT